MRLNMKQPVLDYEGPPLMVNKTNPDGTPVLGEDHKTVQGPELLRNYGSTNCALGLLVMIPSYHLAPLLDRRRPAPVDLVRDHHCAEVALGKPADSDSSVGCVSRSELNCERAEPPTRIGDPARSALADDYVPAALEIVSRHNVTVLMQGHGGSQVGCVTLSLPRTARCDVEASTGGQSVRLHVALSQTRKRHGVPWFRTELHAVGSARPVRPGVDYLAVRPMLDQHHRAAVEVMRRVDWRECLEDHL